MTDPLRVLVVDDSKIYQRIVTRLLASNGDVVVVGTCVNGAEALEFVDSNAVDLVLLDVEMPVMDGLQALEQLSARHPEVSVLMVSGVHDARRTLKALGLGAVDFIAKPEGDGARELAEGLERGIRVVRAQQRGRVRPHAHAESAATVERGTDVRAPDPHAIVAETLASRERLVVLGISTGGPRALSELLPKLPADLGAPLLVVQHMPRGFTESLAESLDRQSALSVVEAVDGEAVVPGRVLIAPGGRHMKVALGTGGQGLVVRIEDGPARKECRPSVDLLFESVAEVFGGHVLALVMTGMGTDGCEGVRRLKTRGARVVIQEASSCVVYGMPRAVEEAHLADEAIPLDKLASRVLTFAGTVSGSTG